MKQKAKQRKLQRRIEAYEAMLKRNPESVHKFFTKPGSMSGRKQG